MQQTTSRNLNKCCQAAAGPTEKWIYLQSDFIYFHSVSSLQILKWLMLFTIIYYYLHILEGVKIEFNDNSDFSYKAKLKPCMLYLVKLLRALDPNFFEAASLPWRLLGQETIKKLCTRAKLSSYTCCKDSSFCSKTGISFINHHKTFPTLIFK